MIAMILFLLATTIYNNRSAYSSNTSINNTGLPFSRFNYSRNYYNTIPLPYFHRVISNNMRNVRDNIFKPKRSTYDPSKWKTLLGNKKIELQKGYLLKYDLPDKYYKKIDYSSFQPYMSYLSITNKKSSAYKIVRHNNAYTDEKGFRRYRLNDSDFKVNNSDDYIIALGHHFNEKGVAGVRYLVVTTEGMYTAVTGDVKSKIHTDPKNMFSQHGKKKAGMIEWVVDTKHENFNNDILKHGTVTKSDNKTLQGKILYVYKICN
jgi:hypothetical protein